MDLEVVPALTDPELAAVRSALTRAGVRVDRVPESYASAWRRTAAREAVATGSWTPRGNAGYARSPRSTRGATRA